MRSRALSLLATAVLVGAAGAAPACNPSAPGSPYARALPFEAYPPSHLRAAWRRPSGTSNAAAPAPGARGAVGRAPLVLGDHLLWGAGEGAVEIDVATGETLRPVPRPRSFSWMPEASRSDLWIGRDDSPFVFAIEPGSLSEVWRAACNPGKYRCSVRGARAGSVAVFAGVIDYEDLNGSIGAFGVSAITGQELWRTRPFSGDSMGLKLAADTERAFLMDTTTLRAYHAHTGRALWSRPLASKMILTERSNPLAAGDGVVAFWDQGDSRDIRVLDADSGEEQARIPWPIMVGDMVLEGGALYVSSSWDGDGLEVAAFDARSGQEKWRSTMKGKWAIPPLHLADDALFLLSAETSNDALNDMGGDVIALDKRSGKLFWSHPVGLVGGVALLPRATGGSLLAFEGPAGELIGMRRAASPAAPSDLEITGAVISTVDEPVSLAGLRVSVGGSTVTLDEQGAFSAKIRALGAVTVRLLDIPLPRANAPLRSEPVRVYQAGSGSADQGRRVRVSLVLERVSPWPPD